MSPEGGWGGAAVADWPFGHLGNARWAGWSRGAGTGHGKKSIKTCTCTFHEDHLCNDGRGGYSSANGM